MSWCGLGVWLAAQGSFRVLLFHALTYDQLLEINIGPAVAQKLQSIIPANAFHSVFSGCALCKLLVAINFSVLHLCCRLPKALPSTNTHKLQALCWYTVQ